MLTAVEEIGSEEKLDRIMPNTGQGASRCFFDKKTKKTVRILRTSKKKHTFVMKVKIFKWANVMKECQYNIQMLKAFEDFKAQLEYCNWNKPSDITKSFRTADIVPCKGDNYNRVVFNVGGNKYRMICGYQFGANKVVLYVRFVGAHKTYDKVKVCRVNMF